MFLRGENIVCGTTTTGAGTLTLAACPAAVGGVDPVAAGIFGASGAWPCNPVIVEYTDSTFTTISQMETGRNCTLTLAAAIGSATLTRSPEVTLTGGAENNSAPTAITIGTAANVLVYFGPTSMDTVQPLPAYTTTGLTNNDNLGFTPAQGTSTGTITLVKGTAYFQRVMLERSGLIKTVSLRTSGVVTTPTSNSVAAALYEFAAGGLAGKQVINFGTLSGTSGAPLGAGGNFSISAGAAAYVPGGFYILGLLPVWSGGSGSPTIRAALSSASSGWTNLATAVGPTPYFTVASGDLNDPPTLTSATAVASASEFACVFRAT